jgi:hypothetical protein
MCGRKYLAVLLWNMYDSGVSIKNTAKAFNISAGKANKILLENNYRLRKSWVWPKEHKQPGPKRNLERVAEMKRLRDTGMSFEKIGDHFGGITRQAVQIALKKAGKE